MFRRNIVYIRILWPRRSREVRSGKKKEKKKKRQNDQVIGFFPVKWRTLGPISRRMQLDGSIRETRISRFEENSCSIIGSNDSFPFSINRYSEKFQARFLPDTRGNDNEKNDEKFAWKFELLSSLFPCCLVGVETNDTRFYSSFHLPLWSESLSPLVLTSRYRTNVFDPRS